jgi:hypothetical protein
MCAPCVALLVKPGAALGQALCSGPLNRFSLIRRSGRAINNHSKTTFACYTALLSYKGYRKFETDIKIGGDVTQPQKPPQ